MPTAKLKKLSSKQKQALQASLIPILQLALHSKQIMK